MNVDSKDDKPCSLIRLRPIELWICSIGSHLITRQLRQESIPICIFTYQEWCGFIEIVYREGLVLTEAIVLKKWKEEVDIEEHLEDQEENEMKLSPPLEGWLIG